MHTIHTHAHTHTRTWGLWSHTFNAVAKLDARVKVEVRRELMHVATDLTPGGELARSLEWKGKIRHL